MLKCIQLVMMLERTRTNAGDLKFAPNTSETGPGEPTG